jgi:two-component system NtrC family sensor kinase
MGTHSIMMEEENKQKRPQASEHKRLLRELQQAQEQLLQAEKMASLGQLTAGIAHELNNPIAFIHGNATALKLGFQDLQPYLQILAAFLQDSPKAYEQQLSKAGSPPWDLPELLAEVQEAIAGLQRGSERVRQIISSLRTFSHNGEGPFAPEDIHQLMDASLTLMASKLREVKVEKWYGSLPQVFCQGSRISQVFINILDNALAAMPQGGRLVIHSLQVSDHVAITLADTGVGMDEATRKKVFDPFFTTKAVGEGTGLGMSISYGIIADHKGYMQVHSRKGEGTEVVIYLPLSPHEPIDY